MFKMNMPNEIVSSDVNLIKHPGIPYNLIVQWSSKLTMTPGDRLN